MLFCLKTGFWCGWETAFMNTDKYFFNEVQKVIYRRNNITSLLNYCNRSKIQAFWLLDHGDFEESVTMLLDPMLKDDDVTPEHHRYTIEGVTQRKGNIKLAVLFCMK